MRSILLDEQPHVLHERLKQAAVVGKAPPPARQPAAVAHNIFVAVMMFVWNMITSPWKNKPLAREEILAIRTGLPHGVVDATVYMENAQLVNNPGGRPLIYFCHTDNYVVDRKTTGGADNGQYPPTRKSNVSIECALPPSGNYPVRALVTINGAVTVRIVEFNPKIPQKLQRLITAGA